jgi:DNA-binding response OmpR family regulator
MKRILILDDNPDILDVITLILDTEGYNICGILNGEELMNIISSFNPDLIMLDVMLGNLDGRDLCHMLKENNLTKHIPILMISASHGTLSLSEKKCAPEDFIAKPFDIDDLIGKVNKLLA